MYKIIVTSSDNYEILQSISLYLIAEKLSPCTHIIKNIESFYLWKNKVINDSECLILIKCLSENIEKIEQIISDKHNYKIPEIISHDFNIISNDYKKWFIKK